MSFRFRVSIWDGDYIFLSLLLLYLISRINANRALKMSFYNIYSCGALNFGCLSMFLMVHICQ